MARTIQNRTRRRMHRAANQSWNDGHIDVASFIESACVLYRIFILRSNENNEQKYTESFDRLGTRATLGGQYIGQQSVESDDEIPASRESIGQGELLRLDRDQAHQRRKHGTANDGHDEKAAG